jgi:dTMP kinase
MHLVPAREQRLDDVRADEASASCDDHAHEGDRMQQSPSPSSSRSPRQSRRSWRCGRIVTPPPHRPLRLGSDPTRNRPGDAALIVAAVFVTFEGLDGSGKTTQAELLAEALRRDGRDVVLTREPGGTELGEQIRSLLLDSQDVAPWAEAALFAAARAELVDRVIAPALEAGQNVLCDRYIDSSLAYQGVARDLGVSSILELNLHATRGLLPDRTFLVLVDPEEARRRRSPTDRIERAGEDFARAVDEAYRALAEMFPNRIVTVDGSQPADRLAEEIHGRVRELS